MTDTFEISVEVRSITRCSRCRSAALGPMSFLLQSPRSQNINMIIICRQQNEQNQFNTRSVFKPCYFVAILLVPALLAPAAAAAQARPRHRKPDWCCRQFIKNISNIFCNEVNNGLQ